MSVRRFRGRRWMAFAVSLFVLASAVWLPTSILAQAIPGNPNVPGGGGGGTYPVSDETFKVCDNGDNTKCVEFETSGMTTGNTFPLAFSGTAATTSELVLPGASPSIIFGVGGAIATIRHDYNFAGAFEIDDPIYMVSNSNFQLGGSGQLTWGSAVQSPTAGVEQLAAGVLSPTDGSTGNGWIQMQAGRSMLAADYTNATTTFSNTALSITVTSGRKYTFEAELFVDNATDANGGKINFNGGTATATNFRADCFEVSTVLDNNTQVTALATTLTAATITGSGRWSCAGSFEPSGSGTFIIQAASNGGATTFTMFRGSNLSFEDVP